MPSHNKRRERHATPRPAPAKQQQHHYRPASRRPGKQQPGDPDRQQHADPERQEPAPPPRKRTHGKNASRGPLFTPDSQQEPVSDRRNILRSYGDGTPATGHSSMECRPEKEDTSCAASDAASNPCLDTSQKPQDRAAALHLCEGFHQRKAPCMAVDIQLAVNRALHVSPR